jgi:Fe-S-cluster-containing hydrogenase component 2
MDEFARRIRERLDFVASADSLPTAIVPGNREFRKYDGVPMHPSASRIKCGKCGKCAAECPVGAIPASDPAKTDKDKCITCMRCVTVCPHYARSLNPVMLAAAKAGLKKACSERKEPEIFI